MAATCIALVANRKVVLNGIAHSIAVDYATIDTNARDSHDVQLRLNPCPVPPSGRISHAPVRLLARTLAFEVVAGRDFMLDAANIAVRWRQFDRPATLDHLGDRVFRRLEYLGHRVSANGRAAARGTASSTCSSWKTVFALIT